MSIVQLLGARGADPKLSSYYQPLCARLTQCDDALRARRSLLMHSLIEFKITTFSVRLAWSRFFVVNWFFLNNSGPLRSRGIFLARVIRYFDPCYFRKPHTIIFVSRRP